MIDPAIVFVIRELIMKLYDQQNINGQTLFGFGFLILSLAVARTMAVKFSPGEDRTFREHRNLSG
jgi:uncharacterized membrane protein (DUF373 family)